MSNDQSTTTTSPQGLEEKNPPSGIQAGPPTQIIFGGLANPQRVKKGENFSMNIGALLVDKNGTSIPGMTPVWRTTTPGATISSIGALNGQFRLNNVQTNTELRFSLTTVQYPNISKSHALSLVVV